MNELWVGLLAIAVGSIWIYNVLIRDKNRVAAAWSDIDVQLKRRHELVPRLVNVVKAYADHERATLLAVTELRARSEAAEHLPDKAQIEDEIALGLRRLVVVAEAYPDLDADESFRQLHEQLTEVENHIQYARRYYNGSVRIFNTRIETFPHLLIARPMGLSRAEFFAVDEAEERQAATVRID